VNALEAQEAGPSLPQLGLRKIIEELLEAEVAERLERGYYERGSGEASGHRNGYRTGRLKTAEGEVEYSVPPVRGLEDPFRSRLRPELGQRTEALEDLAVEMYARGLSTRDIEAALCDEKGRSLLSRSAVSPVTERLWEEYEAFASRDLSEYDVAYFFVDGIAERLHGGQQREAVLCAWAITAEGQKVFLHLSPGTKEDTESCRAFFQELKRRGLSDPLLVLTDGAPGLIRAVEVFPAFGTRSLLGPPDAQSPEQGPRRRVAGLSGRSARVLPGAVSGGGADAPRPSRGHLRKELALGRQMLPR